MKILVVEDEPELMASISQSLEKEKYVVERAESYQKALSKIIGYEYSCILLDITLPDGNGLDILKELKKLNKSDSVIIISAKDSLDDKLLGLGYGADDYLTKPFHLAELNARIKAVLRRKSFEGQNIFSINNLTIDFDNHTVSINDTAISLNRKEFDILTYLVENKNRLVTKTSIAEHVWGDYTDESDDLEFIYSQIKNLRKKLNTTGAEIEIRSVYGIGYKLTDL
ncbi:MAG: response regulator transcription factor [Crocinitomicaceae bacterium]|jgi:DNA-binding response OmpR family regulator|nr:response regulator transcription factor [Crocinitomicaceae bacterium]